MLGEYVKLTTIISSLFGRNWTKFCEFSLLIAEQLNIIELLTADSLFVGYLIISLNLHLVCDLNRH